MGTFTGVDISRWQGDVDFDALAAAVSFVIYKGTGGDDGLYADSEFLRNHAQARSHNMHRGIYHFGGSNDATQEADYFYQQCLTNLEQGEVAILDAESGNATNPAWCLTFLQHLESLIGFKPMIYMNHNLMMTKDWSAVSGGDYGLCLADWDGDPNVAVSMHDWTFCAIQQYKDNGAIAGIAGSVDVDAFFAPDISFFDKYGKPAPAPAPDPTPVAAPVDPVVTPTPDPSLTPTPVSTPVTTPPATTGANTSTTVVTPTVPTSTTSTTTTPTSATTSQPVVISSTLPETGFGSELLTWLLTTPPVVLLRGKKTYILGGLMFLTSVEKYLTGDITISQFVTTVQGLFGTLGLGFITSRAAIKKVEDAVLAFLERK